MWFRGLGFKAFGELGLGFKDLRLGIVLGLRAFGVKQLRFGCVKIMVPFWVPTIARHLLFRVPKKGP